jgi:hypothetical protein
MHHREWMSWGHVVAIEIYPQTLVVWGEVMLHYGYPRMYRFVCSTINGCELVWYQTWSLCLEIIPSYLRGSVNIFGVTTEDILVYFF